MVKKLKRLGIRSVTHRQSAGVAGPMPCPVHFDDAMLTVDAREAVDGLGTHTGLCHRVGGPRATGAEQYLAAENRILRTQLQGRLKLSNAERATLGEIAHRLGCKALAEVATVATPDTILAWYRKLVARKFD